MRITTPGRITDRILFLGRTETCFYLVDGGSEYALIGGGLAYALPDVLNQLKANGIDEQKIRHLLVLHAHFDHAALTPVFKRLWPWAVVAGSQVAATRLKEPRAIETIRSANQAQLAARGMEQTARDQGFWDFAGAEVETVVGEGDGIDLGDVRLEIFDAPGHSTCSIAAYLPQEHALFGSDAGGIPYEDLVFTSASSNFDDYQATLAKLAERCEVEIYLAGHYGVFTGEDGRNYLGKAMAAARETRELIEAVLAGGGDIPAAAAEVTRRRMEASPGYFQSTEAVQAVTEQMVKNLVKKSGSQGGR